MPHSSPAKPYRLESVKICGTTSLTDRDLVADMGADYFGALIDVNFSSRSITLKQAKQLFESPPIPGVALLFNASKDRIYQAVDELNPFAIQLIGKETPEFVADLKSQLDCEVWKSIYVPPKGRGQIDLEAMLMISDEYEDSGVDSLLFGAADMTNGSQTKFGGTGMSSDWDITRGLLRNRMVPGYLAGGLRPDNVASAINIVRPTGIDLCSGVESSPGKKDPEKVAKLFEALKDMR